MAEFDIIEKYPSLLPNLKILVVDGSGSSGETYDTDMDASHGAGAEFKEIFSARASVDGGATVVDCTWDTSTGVVTLGNVGSNAQFHLEIKGK